MNTHLEECSRWVGVPDVCVADHDAQLVGLYRRRGGAGGARGLRDQQRSETGARRSTHRRHRELTTGPVVESVETNHQAELSERAPRPPVGINTARTAVGPLG